VGVSLDHSEYWWIIPHLAVVFGFLLAVLALAHMLRERRSPASTIAWLLAIVLLPYVGVPLYLLLGGRKMRRSVDTRQLTRRLAGDVGVVNDPAPVDRLFRTYDIPGATTGNRMMLCTTGEAIYAKLVELIESAERTLHITTFIMHSDEVGSDVRDRLIRKANAGVDVKLLLDGFGALESGRKFFAPLVEAGGQVAYFMPMFHVPFMRRANLRNHRKLAVADGCRVIAGGTNIGSEYIGPSPNPRRWRDLSFALEGPAAAHCEALFWSDWQFAQGQQERENGFGRVDLSGAHSGGATVQIVPSGPDVVGDPLYDVLLSAMFAAQKRLWLATPYFVPDEPLLRGLVLAARRGIDLRLLVPERSNHRMADLVRGPYLREIQRAGGTIQLYTPGMMHAKVALVDDRAAMVGSANLDMRSLLLNYEVAMFIYSAPEIQVVADWLEQLATDTRTGVEPVGMFRDLAEGVARMMAPLL